MNLMYVSLEGNFKARSDSWNHMLGTQIPSIQEGFGASHLHVWHQNLGR